MRNRTPVRTISITKSVPCPKITDYSTPITKPLSRLEAEPGYSSTMTAVLRRCTLLQYMRRSIVTRVVNMYKRPIDDWHRLEEVR